MMENTWKMFLLFWDEMWMKLNSRGKNDSGNERFRFSHASRVLSRWPLTWKDNFLCVTCLLKQMADAVLLIAFTRYFLTWRTSWGKTSCLIHHHVLRVSVVTLLFFSPHAYLDVLVSNVATSNTLVQWGSVQLIVVCLLTYRTLRAGLKARNPTSLQLLEVK